MKKTLMAALFVMAGVAQAGEELAYTANKLGGNIIFTYTPCVYLATGNRVPDQYYVYSTDTAGNKVVDGCYAYKHPFYFVEWNKGGRLSVNVNSVTSFFK